MDGRYQDWTDSAAAWIAGQGEDGDTSRRKILDPALERLLGEVAGLKVLDVGSGQGRYVGKLRARQAASFGLDPTLPLLRHARTAFGSHFVRGDGAALPFRDASFDLVLSYLTILDIPDYQSAAQEMVRVCKPGGRILVVTISNMASTSDRWVKDEAGNRLYRTVDRYMEEFSMRVAWSGLEVDNYHRPLSNLLRPFFQSGAVMTAFEEPLPPTDSEWYVDERRCPTFQIYEFRKGLGSESFRASS